MDSLPLEYSVREVLHRYIRALADFICDRKKYQQWLGHLAKKCPQRKGMKAPAGQTSKSANVTIGNTGDGINQSTNLWVDTGANVARGSTILMGNGSHASVHGVGTVVPKFTSGKIVQLKNMQHVPTIDMNLVSCSRLTRDGFKLVFESNKVVVSKHGYFIGKGYECGGLRRFLISDFCNKSENHICGSVDDEAIVWHSRLCHINFGLMFRLSSIIAYRFLIVKFEVPDMHVGTIMESRDATFFESFFPMKDTHSSSSQPSEIIPSSITPPEQTEHTHEHITEEDDSEAPRRSKRQRTAKSFGDDFTVYLVDDTPKLISEAYATPDADYWKEAVRSEMDSIIANGTWEVIERPYGCKPVGCKWVFKKKLRPDASHGLLVHQMDVKTAFFNGELDEEIYMDQPDGFVVEGQEGKVCKLLKFLYGLKQAPKQWHEKFDKTLTSAGFAVNEADKCVYYHHGGGEGVSLCLYVDDILIFGTNLEVINEVKSFLSQNFDMKDLGVADVILNIKLIRGENGITLLQSHYVEMILNRFGYIDSKPSPTPYDPSLLLRKNKRIARNQLEYSQIIGSLMYLASATRPDISFAGYSDSNWISDVDEIKATSGYVFTLGGGAASWSSYKQTILTRSTMKTELTALDTATVKTEWLRDLLMDLPIVEKPEPAIHMNCDNQMVVKVNSSKDNMKSSRHVKRRLKSVRKLRNSKVITLHYIQTARNLVDPFTKGLSRNVIDSASKEIGLRPM
uniref:Retrotransposon protein, putative, Ty1-copia subclass n=1 Tax=Oryza sativa subsp. japonica TaxID=39947 RepID=Q2QUV0_ORYSJ|nr:retrotransposon protein, putative, Ty1-copia subclass [Oryza sativa Japonica Group]